MANKLQTTIRSYLRDANISKRLLLEVYRNVGQFSIDWISMFPMLVLEVLPLSIFYFIMQRQIISGVAAGAVKG